MGFLTAADAIRVWELSHGQRPAERAISVLTAAFPEQSHYELQRLTLGQCNARLLDLRDQVFGSKLNGSSECANCGARLEFTLNSQAFPRAHPAGASDSEFILESDQYWVRFRLLNIADLNFARAGGDVPSARLRLIKRCVLEARCAGLTVAAEELPETVIAHLAARLAECDPEAEVLIDLSCPACEFRYQLPLDIAAFFCTEIAAEAQRLLREVHALARTYGWREAEILEMSAPRRQFYLDMLDQ